MSRVPATGFPRLGARPVKAAPTARTTATVTQTSELTFPSFRGQSA